MIGGHDVSLLGTVHPGDADVLLRASRAAWPKSVVESGDGSIVVPVGQALRLQWPVPSEVFVYETHAAYESWTASGLTTENATHMVAITIENDCISFVVNAATGPTTSLVEEMIQALKENRWLALAQPVAA